MPRNTTVNLVSEKGRKLTAEEHDETIGNLKQTADDAFNNAETLQADTDEGLNFLFDNKLDKTEQAADSAKLQGKGIGTEEGDVLTQGATHIVNSTSENLACAVSSVARSEAASGFFGFKAQYSVASNTIFKLSGTRYSGSRYVPFEVKITFYTGLDGVGLIGICESSDLNLPVEFYYKHSTREIIIGVNQNSTYRNFNMSISYISWRARCFFENITEVPADFSLYTITYRQIVYNDTVDVLANKKISFQNTNDAAANVLDWYEEGSFTPVVIGSTTAGTGAYLAQAGKYVRVGNRVHFSLRVRMTTHTGAGGIEIGGLPFLTGSVGYPASVATNYLTFTGQLIAFCNPNSTKVRLLQIATGTNSTDVPFDTGFEAFITGSYEV